MHAASTPGASCSRGQQGSQSTRSVLVLLKVDRSRDWDRSRAPVISGQVKPKAVQRAKRKKVLVERDRKSIQGYMLLPRQAKLHAWQQFPCPWSAVHAGVAKCCHPRPTSSGTKHIIAAICAVATAGNPKLFGMFQPCQLPTMLRCATCAHRQHPVTSCFDSNSTATCGCCHNTSCFYSGSSRDLRRRPRLACWRAGLCAGAAALSYSQGSAALLEARRAISSPRAAVLMPSAGALPLAARALTMVRVAVIAAELRGHSHWFCSKWRPALLVLVPVLLLLPLSSSCIAAPAGQRQGTVEGHPRSMHAAALWGGGRSQPPNN